MAWWNFKISTQIHENQYAKPFPLQRIYNISRAFSRQEEKKGVGMALMHSSCPGDHQYHDPLDSYQCQSHFFSFHDVKAGVRRKFTSLMFNLVQAEATKAEEPLLQCSCLAGSQLHIARTRQQLQPSLQLPLEGNPYLVWHQHTASLYLH